MAVTAVDVDVALVPDEAMPDRPAVFIVVDLIRASTTLTTLLDLGCSAIYIEGSLVRAKQLARRTGSILIGERNRRRPEGFDFANSPLALVRAGVHDGGAILSTTNGTAILRMLRRSDHVLVGCLRNARACAGAAVRLAAVHGLPIRVVCAGLKRRFVLDDAVAAGVIAARIVEVARSAGLVANLSDAARAAVRLYESYPDTLAALVDSDGGRTLVDIGEEEDLPYCAEVDVTDTVPVLRDGQPMRILRLSEWVASGPRTPRRPSGSRRDVGRSRD